MIRILLVEDEPRMNDALQELLRQERYQVTGLAEGTTGLKALLEQSFDLAVLDVMLPGLSGFEIVSAARKAGIQIPILLLTAKSDMDDKVRGLDCGADDYLTKPFDPRELLARVRALARRLSGTADTGLSFGDIVLQPDSLTLSGGGQTVRLTQREARLLEALIRAGGSRLSREQLALQGFGYQDGGEYNNVEVYLTFLRRKLGYLRSTVSIKAERGLGYHLLEENHVP